MKETVEEIKKRIGFHLLEVIPECCGTCKRLVIYRFSGYHWCYEFGFSIPGNRLHGVCDKWKSRINKKVRS